MAFAGGLWLLLLYSLSTTLFFIVHHAPGSELHLLWDDALPGFDTQTSLGIALGFPLSFLYGAAGAVLFAGIYNLVPGVRRVDH